LFKFGVVYKKKESVNLKGVQATLHAISVIYYLVRIFVGFVGFRVSVIHLIRTPNKYHMVRFGCTI